MKNKTAHYVVFVTKKITITDTNDRDRNRISDMTADSNIRTEKLKTRCLPRKQSLGQLLGRVGDATSPALVNIRTAVANFGKIRQPRE